MDEGISMGMIMKQTDQRRMDEMEVGTFLFELSLIFLQFGFRFGFVFFATSEIAVEFDYIAREGILLLFERVNLILFP